MAKEMVTPALLTKLEDNLLFDLHRLHHYQFRPSIRPFVKAYVGFLQISPGAGWKGETDILYIDVEKEKVVKRVEVIDITDDRRKTDCMALTMHRDKLYVVDTGLDCIYTLFHEDGEDQAEVFGTSGRQENQFSGVSSVVVDDEGNMVISDTRNNRLQVVSNESEFVAFVKVRSSVLLNCPMIDLL